jgi:lipopolysaccharide export system protein LptA
MNRLTAGVLCVACLFLGVAAAPSQPGPSKGPIDIEGDSLEVLDAQHLAIWRGNVDAVQGQDRLRSDVLDIYYTGKATDTGQGAAAAPAPGGGPAASSQPAAPGSSFGKVDHMVAEGHVYFVSPTQDARGDHAVYDVASDLITMTGDVVVVQGQSVIHGQKLVIDRKTNHATMVATDDGQTTGSGRVRGVFYPNEQNGQSGPAGSAGAAGSAGSAGHPQ